MVEFITLPVHCFTPKIRVLCRKPVEGFAEGDSPAPPSLPCSPSKADVDKETPEFTEVQVHKTVEAYMLEFAVTVHSLFIGIPVGVADKSTLQILFVALCSELFSRPKGRVCNFFETFLDNFFRIFFLAHQGLGTLLKFYIFATFWPVIFLSYRYTPNR